MAKEQGIPYRGRILEVLPSGQFRVQAPDDIIVLATVANRARRDLRHIAVGEAVRIEVTPYDRHRGRIVARCEAEDSTTNGRQEALD